MWLSFNFLSIYTQQRNTLSEPTENFRFLFYVWLKHFNFLIENRDLWFIIFLSWNVLGLWSSASKNYLWCPSFSSNHFEYFIAELANTFASMFRQSCNETDMKSLHFFVLIQCSSFSHFFEKCFSEFLVILHLWLIGVKELSVVELLHHFPKCSLEVCTIFSSRFIKYKYPSFIFQMDLSWSWEHLLIKGLIPIKDHDYRVFC